MLSGLSCNLVLQTLLGSIFRCVEIRCGCLLGLRVARRCLFCRSLSEFHESDVLDGRLSTRVSEITVVSFNACTPASWAKRRPFDRQWHELGAFMIGFQEARPKKPGIYANENYIKVTSRATNDGTHGCEFWISSKIPIGYKHGRKVLVRREDVSAVCSDHRHIVLRVHTTVTSFYACLPCSAS